MALFAAEPGEDLQVAARRGQLAEVKKLLDAGAPLESKNQYGATPLYLAVFNGHTEVALFLLEKGANPNVTDTFYKSSIIDSALQKERPEIIKALIARGGPVSQRQLAMVATDESLNPFNPDNGPPYSEDFIARYRAAQRARNQRITDYAKTELARLNAAGVPDRLMPLFRCWGDLRMMDGAIDPSDRKTPWCYRGHPATANKSPSIGRANNLKTWLSMWSLETSKCQGGEQLAKFDMPCLVVQGLADTGVFPSDAHKIFGNIGTSDKRLQLIKGAHYFEDSRAERDAMADLLADWVNSRA